MKKCIHSFLVIALCFPLISYGMAPTEPLRASGQQTPLENTHSEQTQDLLGIFKDDIIPLGEQLVHASFDSDWEMVKTLIHQKAPLNEKDSLGCTALIHATCRGRADIVQLLIEANAELNHKENSGFTALICAVLENRKEIARLLINAHADLHQRSYYDKSALIYAVFHNRPEITRMIVEEHVKQLAKPKERVYTTLLCFKRLFGLQYHNMRDIFKATLKGIIQEVRQPMLDDINRIKNVLIKEDLLAMCYEKKQQEPEQRKNRKAKCIIC